MDFTDKVCVITGGANGIGRCIAEAFAQAGGRLAVIDTDAQAGKRLAAQTGALFTPRRHRPRGGSAALCGRRAHALRAGRLSHQQRVRHPPGHPLGLRL